MEGHRDLRYNTNRQKRRMIMPLFEVAMIEVPTANEMKEGAVEKMLMEPTPVIANDQQTAAIQAAVKSGVNVEDMSRVQVLVRPFR